MSRFQFKVQYLSYGSCSIVMYINDKIIEYHASYLGQNPLATMIDACADLMEDDGDYYIEWQAEPGCLKIHMNFDEEKMLHFDIVNHNGEDELPEWHETVAFEDFVSSIQAEGLRILNAFGLCGYKKSWANDVDFPLTNLLRIIGRRNGLWMNDSCTSSIQKEIKCIAECVSELGIKEETKYDECTIFYESWQIQCCGAPFAIGDKIEWNCTLPSEYKNAHGIPLDFEEEHHGSATHSIVGTVTKIISERSEFPKGKREVWYKKAMTIHDEIQKAEGWESDYKGDDQTDRKFWGYIVTLKDVTVKPIKNMSM